MTKCVFCEIIKGKLAGHKIYDNKKTIVILVNNPISKGHCLVIPKKHFENIYDIDENNLKQVILTAKKMSNILKNKLGTKGINILHASGKAAQQSISHFHIHLVPRYEKDGLDTWPSSTYNKKNIGEVYNKIKN